MKMSNDMQGDADGQFMWVSKRTYITLLMECDRYQAALARTQRVLAALQEENARLREYEAGYHRLLLVEAQCEAELERLRAADEQER